MSADEGGMAPRKAAGSPRCPARGGRRRDSLRAEQLEYQAPLGGRDVPTVPRHRAFLGTQTWWTPPVSNLLPLCLSAKNILSLAGIRRGPRYEKAS